MDWKKEAERDLRDYLKRKQAIDSITQKIESLKESAMSIKSASTDTTPVQGGSSKAEENLLNNIVERDRLMLLLKANMRLVKLVDNALLLLTEKQRLVLEKFYIDRPHNHVDCLAYELNVEQAQVYRIKDEAIRDFTIAMYGLTEY